MDSEASAWAIGTRLVLDGLSTSDLNGLVASVSVPFDSSSGRYVVKLESDDRVVRMTARISRPIGATSYY